MQGLRRFERPGGALMLGYRREGVPAVSGCLLAVPLWVIGSLRWHFSSTRAWSVEIYVSGRLGIGKKVHVEEFSSEAAAVDGYTHLAAAIDEGEFDHLLV